MYHIYACKTDTQENLAVDFRSEHNTEAMIRGLIHEGFEVTIKEYHEKNEKQAWRAANEGYPQPDYNRDAVVSSDSVSADREG